MFLLTNQNIKLVIKWTNNSKKTEADKLKFGTTLRIKNISAMKSGQDLKMYLHENRAEIGCFFLKNLCDLNLKELITHSSLSYHSTSSHIKSTALCKNVIIYVQLSLRNSESYLNVLLSVYYLTFKEFKPTRFAFVSEVFLLAFHTLSSCRQISALLFLQLMSKSFLHFSPFV